MVAGGPRRVPMPRSAWTNSWASTHRRARRSSRRSSTITSPWASRCQSPRDEPSSAKRSSTAGRRRNAAHGFQTSGWVENEIDRRLHVRPWPPPGQPTSVGRLPGAGPPSSIGGGVRRLDEQLHRVDAELVGQPLDDLEAVALAPLETADVGAVDLQDLGELSWDRCRSVRSRRRFRPSRCWRSPSTPNPI